MEYTPNPELERLKAEKEKNEKEIEQINHKITLLENRQKYFVVGRSVFTSNSQEALQTPSVSSAKDFSSA